MEDRRKRGEGPRFYCVLSPDLLRHQALRATSHLHGTPGPCRVGDQETANYKDSGVIMASIFSALAECRVFTGTLSPSPDTDSRHSLLLPPSFYRQNG